jgi:hypothetical protein
MGEHLKETEPPQFLSGWKEIAIYLGKAVRTVQRYERQLGLPVRRPAGKSRGSVIATKAELDGWVQASPIREVFRLPNKTLEYQESTITFKEGLREMTRLSGLMRALRKEVTESVRMLRESVSELQGELNHNDWRDSSYLETVRGTLVEKEFRLIELAKGYPKAS